MSSPARFLKRAFVLLLPFAAAGLLWALIVAPLQSYDAELASTLDAKRDLVTRYRRLTGQREAFEAELKELEQAKGAAELFYAAADANAGAALLQQKLSGLVTAGGGQLRLARADAKPKADTLERFGVTLSFAVSTVGLSKLLYSVEGLRPAVLVDSLHIRAGSALARLQNTSLTAAQGPVSAEEPVLEVTLTVSGFLLPKG